MMRSVVRLGVLTIAILWIGVTAMAQPILEPQTFSVLSNAMRQPSTYITASALVPDGVGSVHIVDNINDAEASDPANNYILKVELSDDGGITWYAIHIEYWQGGTHVDKQTKLTVPNHMRTGFGPPTPNAWFGKRVRATLDLPVRMKTGFTVTVNPVGP